MAEKALSVQRSANSLDDFTLPVCLTLCRRGARTVKELFLKPWRHLIGFDRADGVRDTRGPGFHVELAELDSGVGAVARVVIRESGVPPDARVDARWQIQPVA